MVSKNIAISAEIESENIHESFYFDDGVEELKKAVRAIVGEGETKEIKVRVTFEIIQKEVV